MDHQTGHHQIGPAWWIGAEGQCVDVVVLVIFRDDTCVVQEGVEIVLALGGNAGFVHDHQRGALPGGEGRQGDLVVAGVVAS